MTNFELDMQAVEKAANAAMENFGAEFQRLLDQLHETHAGEPPEAVQAALHTACRRVGLTPDAGQLQSWGQAISDGTRIVLDIQKVRSQP